MGKRFTNPEQQFLINLFGQSCPRLLRGPYHISLDILAVLTWKIRSTPLKMVVSVIICEHFVFRKFIFLWNCWLFLFPQVILISEMLLLKMCIYIGSWMLMITVCSTKDDVLSWLFGHWCEWSQALPLAPQSLCRPQKTNCISDLKPIYQFSCLYSSHFVWECLHTDINMIINAIGTVNIRNTDGIFTG